MDSGRKIKAIILDFDGTIVRLFEKYDLDKTKEKLRSSLCQYGVDFSMSQDCFEIFNSISTQLACCIDRKNAALELANEIIVSAECEAIYTGIEVNGFLRFLSECKRNGMLIGIASNNSVDCIVHYLEQKGVSLDIPIAGRDVFHVERMKPNPSTIIQIMHSLDVNIDDTLFVGDTVTDYLCAKQLGMRFIGMVPTDRKRYRLKNECSGVQLVQDFDELGSLTIIK